MKHGAFLKKLALVLAMSVILALGLPAAFAEEPQITGISVDLSEDGTLVAALGQNVDVKADEAKATITVAGGTSTGDEAYLRPEVTSVTVEVNHDVSDPSGNGFSYDISGLPANPEVAVYANQSNAENAPQVTVNMNGNDVSVGSAGTEGPAFGVYANGQNVAVNAAGDVTASVSTAPADTDNTTAQAIITDSGATVKADSVQAEGYEAAAVSANGGSHVEAGSATATGVITATAVDANSRSDVKVETAVAETKEDNNDSTATAIQAASGSTVTADNATATSTDGTAIAVSVTTSGSENPTTVIINEDASSSDIGVRVDGSRDEDKAVVEVGGTLKVDEGGTPVLLGSGVTEDNIEITVWKVEIDGEQAKEGEIVKTESKNPTEEQTAAAKAVEESIQYIIKIDPSQTKNIQSSADKASANDTITVTITPPEGKKLDAVYSDEGKKIEATENEDGTYSVTVRAGGGMYLSAEFSEKPVDPTPDPTPDPEPKPEPKPIPVPVPLPSNIGIAPANDWATATVRLEPEHGAYTLYLTKRVPTMTFLRQTLEKFAKYNDKLIINTPYGNCEISISELLNFNQKAVNFRIVVTDTAVEFYVNGEFFSSIPISDLT